MLGVGPTETVVPLVVTEILTLVTCLGDHC